MDSTTLAGDAVRSASAWNIARRKIMGITGLPDWASDVLCARIALIGLCLLALTIAHWWVPTAPHSWHAIHLGLRKLFFIPVILAAIWFNLRGALFSALAVTVLYLPHVFVQWTGQYGENLNQLGEVATVWVTAAMAGVLVGLEKDALKGQARAHEGALVALVKALDAREHDTQLHSLRVRAYSMRLGQELGMGRNELTVLGQAALLHDVGKIGVPDHVLLKPASLTDGEWKLMRTHPGIGRRILEPVEFLREAAEIVYSHHEKYDGTGYPDGKSEDHIPLGARIFALADAFDALTSERPYQGSLTFEEAKDRILASSGSHFDPRVVQAFSSISKEDWEDTARNLDPHSSDDLDTLSVTRQIHKAAVTPNKLEGDQHL